MLVNLSRILIVEDDADLRGLLESVFAAEGFITRTASEGAEALRLVGEETPDLIVLDLMLPWVNGIEVLAALRQQPHLTNVPVLVTTGTATTPFDLRGFEPLRVMRKPLDVDSVIATARKLLNPVVR